jgi:hypothetical protein
MTTSIRLALLKCLKCGTLVPAQADEVAWTCAQCGQGWRLTETGLAPLNVFWAAGRPQPAPNWFPFWVMPGRVTVNRRETFGGSGAPNPWWTAERRFYIPAFPLPLEQLQALGAAITYQQTPLKAGPAGTLQNCTLLPEEAPAVAEFIVLTIEAEQRDKLRQIDFTLTLGNGELWVLPFAGPPAPANLALA